MYNRYIPSGEAFPVEPPEASSSSPASPGAGAEGAGGSLLGRLLGGMGGSGGLLSGLTGGGGLSGGLRGLLDTVGLGKLDKGDILLLLVLIYLFQDSGDDEWLIILALVLLMGL